jgi:hypothetical protein
MLNALPIPCPLHYSNAVNNLRLSNLGLNIGNTWLPIALSHTDLPFVESNHRVSPDRLDLKKSIESGFDVMKTKENLPT